MIRPPPNSPLFPSPPFSRPPPGGRALRWRYARRGPRRGARRGHPRPSDRSRRRRRHRLAGGHPAPSPVVNGSEIVPAEPRYAGFLRRLGAVGIDALLAYLVLSIAINVIVPGWAGDDATSHQTAEAGLIV